MRTYWAIVLTLLFCASSLAEEVPLKKTVIINLGTGTSTSTTLVPEKTSEVMVEVRYIPPKLQSQYVINIEYEEDFPKPLKKPESADTNPPKTDQEQGNGGGEAVTDPCNEKEDKLNKISTPNGVVEFFKTVNGDDTIGKECTDRLLSLTTKSAVFEILADHKATISVVYLGSTVFAHKVSQPKTEWLTHVGFSFIDNRGESYYSQTEEQSVTDEQGNTTSQSVHVVTKQHNQDSVLYGASVLYTYPTNKLSDDWEFGFTAGLSANSNTVAVLVGPSLILRKNVLINLGLIAQEFDELSGTFEEGQILTGDPLDSSALTSKKFKTSLGITIGFNFGGED